MITGISKSLLWLFVINLGVAFGAGLYEARVEFPRWLVFSPDSGYHWNAEAARRADTGLRFWVYVTTVPLSLLAMANLIVAWRMRGAIRRWWLGAAVVALADRLFTFAYFVPTMVTLIANQGLSQSQAAAMALRWGQLNHLRHVIVLTAWLLALKALSLLAGRRADDHGRGF